MCKFLAEARKTILLSVIRILLFTASFSSTHCEILSGSLFTVGVIHVLALSMSQSPAFGITAGSKIPSSAPQLNRSLNSSLRRFESIAALGLRLVLRVKPVLAITRNSLICSAESHFHCCLSDSFDSRADALFSKPSMNC